MLAAAAAGRDGRRDHLDRRRHEARLRARRAGRPGPRDWAGEYLNERLAGLRARQRSAARRFEDPASRPASASSSSCSGPAFTELLDARRAAALRRRRRRPARRGARRRSSRRASGCSRRSSSARALLELARRGARLAAAVRPRRRRARRPALRDVALVGAPTASRTARSAPSACSARCAWTTRRRSAPSARRRTSSRASSRTSTRTTSPLATLIRMATTERDYYELLGVAARRDEAEIKRAFRRLARELHPDVSDAPDAEERFREVVEAYEVLSKSETRELYDRYGHAGLRSGGFRPDALRLRQPLRHLLGVLRRRPLRRRDRAAPRRAAPTSPPRSRSSSSRRRRASRARVPFQVAALCETLRRQTASSPGRAPATCPTLRRRRPAPAGLAERLRRVRPHARPARVRRRRADRRAPCAECDGAGRVLEERALEVEIPPGIHDGQRIRLSGEGHAGALGGRAGDVYVLVRVRPDERFVREGDDIFSTVDLTMTQAALGATVTVPTLDGERRARVRARNAARRGARAARAGHAGAPGLRPRRPPRARQRRRAAPADRRAAAAARASSSADARTRSTYRADEGFFEKLKSAFR